MYLLRGLYNPFTKVCIAEINKTTNLIMNFKYSASRISNKIVTNQINNDLVIPFHDVKNYYASMDQNKPMVGNQTYLGMNSMA